MMTNFLAGGAALSAGRGLDAALRNLETCAWVGTTETLARDVEVLPAMLGLRRATEVPHHNPSAHRPPASDISPAAMQVLKSLTSGDRILYERAQVIAEEQQRLYA